jgi:hypothetical protein
LNAVYPDGFEYYFVDEEFVVGREFEISESIIIGSQDGERTGGGE